MTRSPAGLLAFLLVTDLGLAALNLLTTPPAAFDLDAEHNLATGYAGLKLAAIAAAALGCGRARARAASERPQRFAWGAVAILFGGLALDEVLVLHERATAFFMSSELGGRVRDRLLGGDQAKDAFAWPVLLAPLILATIGWLAWAWSRALASTPAARRWVLAGCGALLAAVALESPVVIASPPIAQWGPIESARYRLSAVLEEGLELVATSLILAGLWRHARWRSEPPPPEAVDGAGRRRYRSRQPNG